MQPNIELEIQRLDARAPLPRYHSELAAGMDLAACLPRGEHTADELIIEPGEIVKVPTGLAIAIPPDFEGQVRPRSGLATKHGLTLPNTPGTIDADYRGELTIALINLGQEPMTIKHAQRIAQLVIAPIVRAEVVVVEQLDATARATGGFGSTGIH